MHPDMIKDTPTFIELLWTSFTTTDRVIPCFLHFLIKYSGALILIEFLKFAINFFFVCLGAIILW